MTMAEIDQRRTDLDELRKRVDAAEADKFPDGCTKEKLDSLRYLEACAEANVLVALREWWAQGCREVKVEPRIVERAYREIPRPPIPGMSWLADEIAVILEADKALLSEALEHLEAHDYEYHHRTPPELLARLRAATSHG